MDFAILSSDARLHGWYYDGPDEIRKAVRFDVKNGADVIRAAVSGGLLSLTDEVDTPQLTPTEMAALVDESHRLRKKVTVRCHGD